MPDNPDRPDLLQRILHAPDLKQVVPALQPELLHRVIQHHGLEDCAELVAHATPEQLARVFDLDLWRSARPGRDEQFDAERFGAWIEVLLDAGESIAAQKLAALDADLVVVGLAQHARVFDLASGLDDSGATAIGGYCLLPRRTDSWDPIVTVLTTLAEEQPDAFQRVMQGCRTLSNSKPEIDGLDDLLDAPEQAMFDLAGAREERREAQGYVPAAEARAFLEMARSAGRRGTDEQSGRNDGTGGAESPALQVRHRFAHVRRHMEDLQERDPDAFSAQIADLAFLTNVLMSGCSVQARPFTAPEASEAAAAVCNLGFDVSAAIDLIGAFRAGWSFLSHDVCMFTARRLIRILDDLRCPDVDIQSSLDALSAQLAKQCRAGTPWRARDAMEVISMLDAPAWAALLGLIDEFPVMHAALAASNDARIRSVSASAFEFISERSQIAAVREFLHRLPGVLRA